MKNLYITWLAAMVFLATAHGILAQTYTIKAHTFGGGGGSSAGHVHALRGTIGQHDAGSRKGQGYSLAGGFWSVAAVVTAGDGPTLRIMAKGRTVIIAWPDPSAGFQLQQTRSLAAPVWTDVPTNPTIQGTEKQVTIPLQPGTQFFRLQKAR
jgi:hypothetical protein